MPWANYLIKTFSLYRSLFVNNIAIVYLSLQCLLLLLSYLLPIHLMQSCFYSYYVIKILWLHHICTWMTKQDLYYLILKKNSKRKFLKKQISFPALRTYKIKVPWFDPDMGMETVTLIADAACTLSYHNMSQNEAFFFFAKSCNSLFLISNFLCVLICCYFYFLLKKNQKQKWMV